MRRRREDCFKADENHHSPFLSLSLTLWFKLCNVQMGEEESSSQGDDLDSDSGCTKQAELLRMATLILSK